jgi:ribosome biogenesis GTPase
MDPKADDPTCDPFTLRELGWCSFFQEQRELLEAHLVIGRVAVAHREHYLLLTESGQLRTRLGGRLRHQAVSPLDMPAVGDWVAATPASHGHAASVVHVFARRTRFVRKVAGRRTEVQVVAANVDHVAVVTTPNDDFNVRRLERYVAAIRESGAEPVFVLNKVDLCDDPAPYLAQFGEVAKDVSVIVSQAVDGVGLDGLRALSGKGDTLVLVGSSGVGKSTIVNRMLGSDVQRVGEIRARDGRGRHVTSHRELFLVAGGGLLMDTPGMRELQVWAFEQDEKGFSDIEAIARACRFRDCSHHDEPGCAVRQAVIDGGLTGERLGSFHKLKAEAEVQAQRQEALQALRSRQKAIHRSLRKFYKEP